MKTILFVVAFVSLGLAGIRAEDEQGAYQIAKNAVPDDHQKKVLSFYGRGTVDEIKTWYVKFYDPTVKSQARVVVVENGKVDRSNTADDQEKNDSRLSFNPAQYKVSSKTALNTAVKYAKDSVIPYDAVRVYLNRPGIGRAPVWTVELLYEGRSQGYIYANDQNGSYAGYRPPQGTKHAAREKKSSSSSSGEKSERSSDSGDGKGFGEEVKDTFLGIGGDLEEFFTGERTVDR